MSEQSQLIVEYGIDGKYLNVTNIALEFCVNNNILSLPSGDHQRAMIFGDPLPNILKNISITIDNNQVIYPDTESISIDVSKIKISEILSSISNDRSWYNRSLNNPIERLSLIHKNLIFLGGNIKDEYPEQVMVATYLNPDAKVLEIGSNIGRNTLTIATILYNQNNLVTLECDQNTCKLLRQNMRVNHYDFHIEESALSYRKLIQKGWDTIPSETLLPGYTPVNCVTYQELESKYNIQFDTLVADCEGALFYILTDYPDMLNNLKLIIMENDYHNITHKSYVDSVLLTKGFKRIFFQAGGWGPCQPNFFEAWSK